MVKLDALIDSTNELWIKRGGKFNLNHEYVDRTYKKYATLKNMPQISKVMFIDIECERLILALSDRGRLVIIKSNGERRYRTSHIRISDFYIRDDNDVTIVLTDGELYRVNNITDVHQPISLSSVMCSNVKRLVYTDEFIQLRDDTIYRYNNGSYSSIGKLKINPIIGTTLGTVTIGKNSTLYRMSSEYTALTCPANMIDVIDMTDVTYLIDEDGSLWKSYSPNCYSRINSKYKWVRFIRTDDGKLLLQDNNGVTRKLKNNRIVKLPISI